jgi:transmembrane protein DUF3566
MTETQAKSGTTGTSMNPVTRDKLEGDHSDLDLSTDHAVGRASVPADGASKVKIDEPGKSGGTADSPASSSTPSASPAATSTSTSPLTSGTATSTLAGGAAVKSSPSTPDRNASLSDTSRSVAEAARSTTDVRSSPAGTRSATPPSTTDKSAVGRSAASAPAGAPSTGAARVADAVRTARQTVTSAASRGPRRARLFVKRVDPWSVMKFAFALSFVLFFVLVVATSVLYLALDAMHVFTSVNKAIADLVPGNKDVKVTAGVVIGASGAIGLVMVVLCTALSTLGAFIYNVCADLVGGIEVTLSEKE